MANQLAGRFFLLGLAGLLVAGCAETEPRPYSHSTGHIGPDAEAVPPSATIPEVARQTPVLPEPTPGPAMEKYTVVVNEVPVREILFALARDADLNVDIYPGISGEVTLNAVDQTLPQILDRISRQVAVRYEIEDNNIIISPDDPFFKSYDVDYVNISRNTTADNRLTTQISTTGSSDVGSGGGGRSSGGDNNSTTDIQSISENLFWQRLVTNIAAIINDPLSQQAGGRSAGGEIPASANIVASPETGVLNVRATSKQHDYIARHVSRVVDSAQRQVVIQVTIAEVQLSDEYEAGINWQALDIADSSISIASRTLFDPVGQVTGSASPMLALQYDGNDFSSVLNMLEEFGRTNVLSSPQLMVMNNQTAILKAVENFVYFEIESDTTSTQTNAITTVNSQVRTVPIGIVMAVTPQISDAGVITLNVRPTVSEINAIKNDPSVALIRAQIAQSGQPGVGNISGDIPENEVPEIRVREMESMLRLNSGQTAILGGLMQNVEREMTNAIPGLSRIPLLGRAFETRGRRYEKSELVIFLRPILVNNPSIAEDLNDYEALLNRRSSRDMGEGY